MRGSRRLDRVLQVIRQLASEGKVRVTYKALRELTQLELGLDELDLCEILTEIREGDFRERVASTITGEWLFVFAPKIGAVEIYLKVVIRENCVVVSFHEDKTDENQTSSRK